MIRRLTLGRIVFGNAAERRLPRFGAQDRGVIRPKLRPKWLAGLRRVKAVQLDVGEAVNRLRRWWLHRKIKRRKLRERAIAREARRSANLFPNSSDAQAAAAWVAVHEARRGISAAWFAAVINILVVTTALGVPYLTKYLADEDRRSDVHDAKMLLMPRLTNLLEALEASHVFDDGGLSDANIPPNQRNDRMESFEEDMRRSDKRRESLYYLMARFPADKNIYRSLDIMEDAEGVFYATIANIRDRLKWPSLYDAQASADDRDLRPAVPPVDRRPALRLLIDINTDEDGDVSPGPMAFGSCDDIAYAKKCMAYLSDYHEGEPKCFELSCTMPDGRKVAIDKAFGQRSQITLISDV